MFNHNHYVPTIKWKLGEYQALYHLSNNTKSKITPLIELPPIGYDFENAKNSKSAHDHLKDFGKRLEAKWGKRQCFVDLKYISDDEERDLGMTPMDFCINQTLSFSEKVIPVYSLESSDKVLASVAKIGKINDRGAALRISSETYNPKTITDEINSKLDFLKIGYANTDLILDLGDKIIPPIDIYKQIVIGIISTLPNINKWRSFTIIGTSYPSTLQSIGNMATILRKEWELYKLLSVEMEDKYRLPTFGDYCASHPDPVELDMRLVKPFAKLKYTLEDSWIIIKGKAVRTEGFGQYSDMCKLIVESKFYDGENYSMGDKFIHECSTGKGSTGNLTSWVTVSTNRHIEKTVKSVANFHDALMST